MPMRGLPRKVASGGRLTSTLPKASYTGRYTYMIPRYSYITSMAPYNPYVTHIYVYIYKIPTDTIESLAQSGRP